MNNSYAWAGTLGAVLFVALLTWASAHGSATTVSGYPVLWLCVALAFLIQWVGFAFAFSLRTERFFDTFGAATFILASWLALLLSSSFNSASLILAGMITIWALRLGAFLTLRIHKTQVDRRFNAIRSNFSVFFMTWTLQGFWITVTLMPSFIVFTSGHTLAFNSYFAIGVIVWGIGLVIEVLADTQKSKFRNEPENQDKFITTGLWSWSQHPNYFGEIMLWIGIAIISLPYLHGWQYFSLISPIFVYLLLTKISGTRMLDNIARKKWGEDSSYLEYTARTPKLVLLPPRK